MNSSNHDSKHLELKQIIMSILGNAPMGVITTNFHGSILLINETAAEILKKNTNLASFIDKNILTFFSKKSLSYQYLKGSFSKAKKEFDLDEEPFGQKFVKLNVRVIINGLLITIEDVTEQVRTKNEIKRYTKKLERQNAELEEFAYITSHDLQEPLNNIISFSNLLLKNTSNEVPPKIKEFLKIIKDSSKRMSDLIHGLLELSRIGQTQEKQTSDSNKVVESVLDSLNHQIQESKATIEYKNLPQVKIFPLEFNSLLQNLISNALKYRRAGVPPVITIDAENREKDWLFSITDNGIGIPVDQYERIFIIFQRLFAHKEIAGTGIGLAHCKKIVDLHGGEIWVNSKPNQGSTFYFNIPK